MFRPRPLTTSRDQFADQAYSLMTSSAAQAAFRLGDESPAVRDKYGRTTFGQSCLLARRLDRSGRVVCHAQRSRHRAAGLGHPRPELPDDQEHPGPAAGPGAVGLARRPGRSQAARSDTLVVMMGEFGRTPKINQNAGRDHHGRANSVLVAGAGIPGGPGSGQDRRPRRPADRATGHPGRPGRGPLPEAGHRPRAQVRGPRRPADPPRRQRPAAARAALNRTPVHRS